MVLVRQRTQPKNRIHAAVANYGLRVEVGDVFASRLSGADQAKLPPT